MAARPEIRRFGRRRRVASVPQCYRVRACRGFADRSVKSSFERKTNMSVSISNSSLTQAAAPIPSPAKSQPSEPSQHPAPAPGDSVKLSQAAQVHLFKQQGQSPSQIASNLGISAATVDGYLGIAVPKAPAATPAVATPTAPSPEPADVHAQAPAQPTPAAGK
jgi:DNA-binding CsgD family transcriptional regulator